MRIIPFVASLMSATVVGSAASAISLSASGADVEYAEPFVGEGEISVVSAVIDNVSGAVPPALITLDIVAGFGLTDPTDESDFAFGGFLDVSDASGQLLVGDLASIAFDVDEISFGFSNLGGSAVASFGPAVIATFSFTSLGANPFASLTDGDVVTARVDLESPAPVPLPASLPLLIVGLGSAVWVRSRRSDSGIRL